MKISIVGTGNMGIVLARKLSAAGHEVKVANSRGPDTVPAAALEFGAHAMAVENVTADAEILILSIPPTSVERIRPFLHRLADKAIIIDTSNYYPQRDGVITSIDDGQVESEWVAEQLGRSVVKAWNTITSASLTLKGSEENDADRIAIPVSGNPNDCETAIALVGDTGLYGHYAGLLSESWRQQPGSPVYCTDLRLRTLVPALDLIEKARLPIRRDIAVQAIMERGFDQISPEYVVSLNRVLFL